MFRECTPPCVCAVELLYVLPADCCQSLMCFVSGRKLLAGRLWSFSAIAQSRKFLLPEYTMTKILVCNADVFALRKFRTSSVQLFLGLYFSSSLRYSADQQVSIPVRFSGASLCRMPFAMCVAARRSLLLTCEQCGRAGDRPSTSISGNQTQIHRRLAGPACSGCAGTGCGFGK